MQVLAAGAAKAVVGAIAEILTGRTGLECDCSFSAVGDIRSRLLAGTPCDVVVLTAAMIDELAAAGVVVGAAPLGSVATGVGIRTGDPVPAISDAAVLRETFLRAPELYTADLDGSTGGRHFASVLDRLGILETVRPRIVARSSGALSLAELGATGAPGAVGCSQLSEFRYSAGTEIVGPLPEPFALRTVYTAAVSATAEHGDTAHEFVELLTGSSSADLRQHWGFEV